MSEKYKVIAKVVSQKGYCSAGHKIGDEFEMGTHTPARMCSYAFNSIFPQACVLMAGGQFSWQKNPDIIPCEACPDSENPLCFELRRITT